MYYVHVDFLQTNDLSFLYVSSLTWLHSHLWSKFAESFAVVFLWPQNPFVGCKFFPDHYLFVFSISLVGVTTDRKNLHKGGERGIMKETKVCPRDCEDQIRGL